MTTRHYYGALLFIDYTCKRYLKKKFSVKFLVNTLRDHNVSQSCLCSFIRFTNFPPIQQASNLVNFFLVVAR